MERFCEQLNTYLYSVVFGGEFNNPISSFNYNDVNYAGGMTTSRLPLLSSVVHIFN